MRLLDVMSHHDAEPQVDSRSLVVLTAHKKKVNGAARASKASAVVALSIPQHQECPVLACTPVGRCFPFLQMHRNSGLNILKTFFRVEENIELKLTKRGCRPLGGGQVTFRCRVANQTFRSLQITDQVRESCEQLFDLCPKRILL